MWPRAAARYHGSCESRVLRAVTTSDMSRNLHQPIGWCWNVRRGSGIEEGRMAHPHLPRPSRLQRQVRTQFEPSHVAARSLAEVSARLAPLRQRPLRKRLRPPVPTTEPTGSTQESQERRAGQQCSYPRHFPWRCTHGCRPPISWRPRRWTVRSQRSTNGWSATLLRAAVSWNALMRGRVEPRLSDLPWNADAIWPPSEAWSSSLSTAPIASRARTLTKRCYSTNSAAWGYVSCSSTGRSSPLQKMSCWCTSKG
jgi:hypothetical protein